LIAGGSGFIGSHLTRSCLKQGDDVTVISLSGAGTLIEEKRGSLQVLKVDLRDKDATFEALTRRSFDKVFNLSGFIDHTPFFKGGRSIMDQHFLALQNLLEGLDRSALTSFIQAASSDEYGNAPGPQREDVREQPIAPYSLGKMAATHLIEMLSATESFPGIVVRFFLVYGPGQDRRRFLPQIIEACLRKESFKASEGRQKRDFTFVEDIVDGLLAASELPKAAQGQVLNLASGHAVTIREVVEQVVALCGGGTPQYGAIPYRPGENMNLVADTTKAKQLLGWTPKTSLQEGLKATIAYYRKQFDSKPLPTAHRA
jgi:UDP-glucose 4-epimerase